MEMTSCSPTTNNDATQFILVIGTKSLCDVVGCVQLFAFSVTREKLLKESCRNQEFFLVMWVLMMLFSEVQLDYDFL